ncbi:sugar kinase [Thalassotalea agarivorans]|uniref:2-dehydro-3-deoxygluconokinase n=1 Tax=Thalassotalea agarivorans TaxID=349064 RepID=A0A1I0DYE0_THASX|nr:sugar kinase [Thalassotalea agarivorans]SET37688.1 2-dehydro-3-deoxygluconokinase [Thalassotalea agarivorans]
MTKRLIAIGECMLELQPKDEALLSVAYAGDTYNAVVYGKRLLPELDCCFFSAVGQDQLSDAMLARWHSEGISERLVQRKHDKTIGIYAISTDEDGERSFSYWRKDSAATQMLSSFTSEQLANHLDEADTLFFSGISLGILSDADKELLLDALAILDKRGKCIAFDPNYRPAMWRDVAHTQDFIEKAYKVASIALPGVDEHTLIFGHQTKQAVVDYCAALGCNEIVVKDGDNGTWVSSANGEVHVPFNPAPVQVDTTAAGDSFAGTYLAARTGNQTIEQALSQACFVAREVVQVKGAIMPAQEYQSRVSANIE